MMMTTIKGIDIAMINTMSITVTTIMVIFKVIFIVTSIKSIMSMITMMITIFRNSKDKVNLLLPRGRL